MIIVSWLKRLKLLKSSWLIIFNISILFILNINKIDKINAQAYNSPFEIDSYNDPLLDPNSINNANFEEQHLGQQDHLNLNDHVDNLDEFSKINADSYSSRYESDCYDSVTGAARRCMPEFVNAAFGLKIIASNTCGVTHPSEYCVQTNLHNYFYSKNGNTNSYNSDSSPNYLADATDFYSRFHSRCQKCDANERRYSHPPEFLNDYNNQGNITWWQSETMLEGVQYPNSVNLTLHLGKSFDINYVQVKFHSPRPESFAIYKRTQENGPWQPYQYYSASCRDTYDVQTGQIVTHENEAIALCTDEFSDIAPLTGASVVFGTLEDRPSAYNFENSPQLKEWVTATDIRITLNRLNTFGDEVFNDPQVLKSYYYAISDIAVGGRCKCNGHASQCVMEQQHDFEDRLKCRCEHNTAGVDCGECLPFYNDVPWAPATQLNAHECKPCSCNGLSNRCHFNQTLYDLTGHGGYCDDCEGNTAGSHCEECKTGFYRRENENRCIDCQCNHFGAESLQCDPTGKCRCKPGVIGEKCDRCAPYHYELSITGCKMCNCNPVGSFDNPPVCDPRDGSCRCKANVEGQNCDRPKPGFFNLAIENIHGAIPCFCYGHSSTCQSSLDYFVHNITMNPSQEWNAVNSRNQVVSVQNNNQDVRVYIPSSQEDIWIQAPGEFLGNQQLSYNQDLSFDLRLIENSQQSQQNGAPIARPSRKDIIIENSQHNIEVYLPIYGGRASQNNYQSLPSYETQTFTFKLNQMSGWMPTLSVIDFQKLLTNVSSIKIRVSYASNTYAVISRLSLTSAKLNSKKTELDEVYLDEYGQLHKKTLKPALFVEQCKCPVGHVGQHCELCADGYKREIVNGGPFSRCVPCNCNNHSLSCDPNTGKCDCMHHTTGNTCEKCEEGYYGNPIVPFKPHYVEDPTSLSPSNYQAPLTEYELSNMCKKCPCPNDGPCTEIFNYQLNSAEVVCLACPMGTQGNLCELCDDGYFNSGSSLLSTTCEKCHCNGNIDENSIGNCDSHASVERCLRCIYNTTGSQCEKCLPNYWGDALSPIKCHSCECFLPGTYESEENSREARQCNLDDGQCDCKPNVKNRQCNECKEGYWNILSGKGCEECKCNPLGSYNLSCNSLTGQCHCRPGVQGLKCDSCMPMWYGFSDEGCKKCECDQFGTQFGDLQCDDFGKCKCRENFAGLKCNQCDENRYNFTSGCLKCEECYNLVQDKVNQLRERIKIIQLTLNELLATGQSSNENVNNRNNELQEKLDSLKAQIDDMHRDLYEKQKLKPTYKESVAYLQSELKQITDAIKNTDHLFENFNSIFKDAERLYNQGISSVNQAQTQLNFISSKNEKQSDKIESIKQGRMDHEQNLKLQNYAKQSRETADKQKEIAQNVSDELRENVEHARIAFRQLQDILGRYESLIGLTKEEEFDVSYDMLKSRADALIAEAAQQKKILDESAREAEEFIKKIKEFKVPDDDLIDPDKYDESTRVIVEEINSKTLSLRKDLDNLKTKFEKFTNEDSLKSISAAKHQLNNAKDKQKNIDDLHNVAIRTKNESDAAISLANEVFANATKILKTLEKFDELILSGKEKMQQAQNLDEATKENIKNANEVMYQVKEKLKNLNHQINDIKRVTTRSVNILNDATSNFDVLQQKVRDLNNLTTQLEERTSNLINKYETETQPRAKEALNLFSNLNTRSDSILKQAEQVTNGTQKLLDNANNALENLNKINKSISDFSVSNIKREEIVRLQRKFDELSAELDSDNSIDESISSLEKSTKYLINTAKQYKYQVEFLRKQVENLDQINNSLERACYANTIAKPEL